MKDLVKKIANKWHVDHRESVEKLIEQALKEYFDDQPDQCITCGANNKRYTHNLSDGLVLSLKKFAIALKHNQKNTLNILKDAGLTVNEVNNFQKLAYFNLVDKSQTKGEWYLTRNGLAFLQGKNTVPKQVTTFRSKIVEKSPHMVHIRDFKGVIEWQQDFTYQSA